MQNMYLIFIVPVVLNQARDHTLVNSIYSGHPGLQLLHKYGHPCCVLLLLFFRNQVVHFTLICLDSVSFESNLRIIFIIIYLYCQLSFFKPQPLY